MLGTAISYLQSIRIHRAGWAFIALFATAAGRPDVAECAFKTVAGAIVNRFRVIAPRAE